MIKDLPEEFKVDKTVENAKELQEYLDNVSKLPTLSHKEQEKLLNDYKNGDSSAEKKVISANLAKVVTYAKKFSGYGVDLFDLIQEGNLTLMKALRGYNYNGDFNQHVDNYLNKFLYHYLANNVRIVELPDEVLSELHQISVVRVQMHDTYGHTASEEEIARELGIPSEKAEFLCNLLDNSMAESMEHLCESKDSALGTVDPIEDFVKDEAVDETLTNMLDNNSINMDELNLLVRNSEIDGPKETLFTLAKERGVSVETVRRQKNKTKCKIRFKLDSILKD